jgi:ABC-type sulfate transport system substrate-binding protein
MACPRPPAPPSPPLGIAAALAALLAAKPIKNAAALCRHAPPQTGKTVKLLNVSYDVARDFL